MAFLFLFSIVYYRIMFFVETSEQAYADLSTNLKAGTLDAIFVYGRPGKIIFIRFIRG